MKEKSSDLNIPLEERIVEGAITSIHDDHVMIDLDNFGIGRLYRLKMTPPIPDTGQIHKCDRYQVGSKLRVFMESTSREKMMWYLNEQWAYDNPWEKLPFEMGDIVEGKVIRFIEDKGVVILLEKELEAALFQSDITADSTKKISNILEKGDHVKAFVKFIDRKNLKIRLDMLSLLKSLKEEELRNKYGKLSVPFLHEQPASDKQYIDADLKGTIALIVDDHPVFLKTLADYLSLLGCDVLKAKSANEVENILNSHKELHVALVDKNLEKGISGLEIIDKISKTYPECITVMVSGGNYTKDNSDNIKYFLKKPLNLGELIPLLSSKGLKGKLELKEKNNELESTHNHPFYKEAAERLFQKKSLQSDIISILEQLNKRINADAAIILYREIVTGQLYFHNAVNIEKETFEGAIAQLMHSMVVDVIGRNCKKEQSDAIASGVDYIRLLFPQCRSAYGVPLKVMGVTEHGLFFFKRDSYFTKEHKEVIDDYIPSIQRIFEQDRLVRWIEEEMSFSLQGRIQAGIVHEINNTLGPILMQIKILEKLWSTSKEGKIDKKSLENVFQQISYGAQDLKNISELFKLMGKKYRGSRCNAISTIRNLIQFMKPWIEREGVRFTYHLLEKDVRVDCPPQVLEHTIWNLVHNAVKYMDKKKWGWVSVNMAITKGPRPLHIIVKDNGLGIHKQLWRNIFEPRFTTGGKKSGAGLGLYIARHMIEAYGGSLNLENSWIKMGSSFVINLPIKVGNKG